MQVSVTLARVDSPGGHKSGNIAKHVVSDATLNGFGATLNGFGATLIRLLLKHGEI